jgi:hypothetical protein
MEVLCAVDQSARPMQWERERSLCSVVSRRLEPLESREVDYDTVWRWVFVSKQLRHVGNVIDNLQERKNKNLFTTNKQHASFKLY